jgi:hypothetical protein
MKPFQSRVWLENALEFWRNAKASAQMPQATIIWNIRTIEDELRRLNGDTAEVIRFPSDKMFTR